MLIPSPYPSLSLSLSLTKKKKEKEKKKSQSVTQKEKTKRKDNKGKPSSCDVTMQFHMNSQLLRSALDSEDVDGTAVVVVALVAVSSAGRMWMKVTRLNPHSRA